MKKDVGNTMMFLFAVILAAAGVFVGDAALDRVERVQALECARNSAGTDLEIVQCYTDRGLPVPEDMK